MDQLNLGGYDYSVNYIAGLTCDDESDKVDGCVDLTSRHIEIEAALDSKGRVETTWHEIIHVLIAHSGLGEYIIGSDEESICAMLGRALPKLIVDNPNFIGETFSAFERFGVLSVLDERAPQFIAMSKGVPLDEWVLGDDEGNEIRIPRSEWNAAHPHISNQKMDVVNSQDEVVYDFGASAPPLSEQIQKQTSEKQAERTEATFGGLDSHIVAAFTPKSKDWFYEQYRRDHYGVMGGSVESEGDVAEANSLRATVFSSAVTLRSNDGYGAVAVPFKMLDEADGREMLRDTVQRWLHQEADPVERMLGRVGLYDVGVSVRNGAGSEQVTIPYELLDDSGGMGELAYFVNTWMEAHGWQPDPDNFDSYDDEREIAEESFAIKPGRGAHIVSPDGELVLTLPTEMLSDEWGIHKLRKAVKKWVKRQQLADNQSNEAEQGESG